MAPGFYAGDTGPDAALWNRLRSLHVASLVIETAFRNDEHQLATISRHMHPAALAVNSHLAAGVQVYITHIKPGDLDPVMSEIGSLGDRYSIHALTAGQVIPVSD